MSLHIRLRLRRAGFTLDFNEHLPGQGVTALFGRSGSGKTTLLRCLAGFEPEAAGEICINGEYWQQERQSRPTHQRELGYVFQEASLFAHLTVAGNLRYAWRRVPAANRRITQAEAIDWLGLGELLRRYPDQLSGGQRQRVAIARAMLGSPQLLLMDEPLAALDSASKAEIMPYLQRLPQQLQMPILYVSHTLEEVAQLADHLVLLEHGRCLGQGALNEMLTRLDLPLASAASASAVVQAQVASFDADYHLLSVVTAAGSLQVPAPARPAGDQVRVRIAARDLLLAQAPLVGISALNSLPVTVLALTADTDPAFTLVRLEHAGQPLLARITRKSAEQMQLAAGTELQAIVKTASLAG
ncbi:molybdenum ABC transporter ATP-binding protein [Halopseudomonas salegens]|uniref:Molybdate transport system ATP-binding protein n=1 Tax=Halopseudomonas salegens TaxID=1434072 RepID=A0A1H2HVD6_9GAMM|nr:molybdenum ABC transporter ATP-binding protein [Halopseudomonas salegens]SDU35764.1 molybdate transport system ATP-binding protein [Halopseudomonas salegens]